ncbi:MAG: SMP-30/gluconolactonase/LRE family protein, partial [Marinomonas sp.]
MSLVRDGETVSLNVIDRDLSDPKKLSASLRRFTWSDGTPEIIEDTLPKTADSLCNANDVIVSGNQYFITSDHQSCRYSGRKRENVFQANSAHLLSFDLAKDTAIQTIIPKLYFANGIATSQDHIYIAETRKKRLSTYDQTAEGLKHRADITLAGGPDNLTVTEDGDLWAALHPNLMTFAAYRAGWRQNAPSRVSRIKTNKQDDRRIQTYDIPSHIISGATVALQVDNTLFLGAAFDRAIASCVLTEESK